MKLLPWGTLLLQLERLGKLEKVTAIQLEKKPASRKKDRYDWKAIVQSPKRAAIELYHWEDCSWHDDPQPPPESF